MFLLACLAPATHAQIGISPIIQETRLDEPEQVMAFRLTSFDDRTRQVKVTVANWTLDEQGEIRELPTDENSLDRWLIVSPLEFELPGKSTQTIRVAIRPAVELAPGEHRAMVYFNEVLAPRPEGETHCAGASALARRCTPTRASRNGSVTSTPCRRMRKASARR